MATPDDPHRFSEVPSRSVNALGNRIDVIDRIRGLALLGILVMNVQSYGLFLYLQPEQVYSIGLDSPQSYIPSQFLSLWLVKGQFYTIYSFLFGLGFYMIMKNSERKGLQGNRIYKRRLWALFLFGLFHAFVLWHGDILHKYALLGFTLLYFNEKSVRSLLKWIGWLLGLSLLFQVLKFVFSAPPVTPPDLEIDPLIMQVMDTWKNGTFMEVMHMQKQGVAFMWITTALNGFSSLVHFEVMFLLGLIAGKLNVFNRIPEIWKKWKWMVLISLPFLLVIKGFFAGENLLWEAGDHAYLPWLAGVAYFVVTPLLTIAYLMLLSRFFYNNHSRIAQWIGNTGRLGLTNYIAQTGMCMALFYGYSGGLSGTLTHAESLLVALGIYAFQVVLSTVWLKFRSVGPLEWLWRCVSYRKGAGRLP